MLEVKNFTNTILSDISFTLDDSENLIILGSNGAGKSTLAKVLCGIIDSNSVTLFDKNLNTLKAIQRAKYINYVPPKLEIFDEHITLEEYLHLSRLFSLESVDEIVKLLNLDTLKDKTCKRLSSGEQQLTMIASSILHNAKITIFDEPTSNLDPQKTLQVYKVLKSRYIQNRIIITHDLNLANKLGYKIIYIKDGKIIFFGTNEKFFAQDSLQKLFGSSIKNIEGHYMVNL